MSDDDADDCYNDDSYHEDYGVDYAEEEEKHNNITTTETSKMSFGQSQIYRIVPDYLFLHEILFQLRGLQDQLGISSGKALWLIQKLKYNQELYNNISSKLIDDLYDSSQHQKETAVEKIKEECQICGDNLDLCSLECGHKFCSSCWREYLTIGIRQGAEYGLVKKCPMDKCKQIVDLEFFNKFLSEVNYRLFEKFIVQDVIIKGKKVIECPGKDCNNLFVLNSYKGSLTSFDEVQFNLCCSCSFAFCSLCREEAHRPLSCQMFRDWTNLIKGKNADEIDSLWIKLNTKKCPNCKVDIQKNKGCMHMTCHKCWYQFCWLCLCESNKHQDCNRFQSKLDKENSEIKKDNSQQLRKYLFFSERFIQHRKSIQFDITKKKIIEMKIQEIYQVLKDKISFEYLGNAILTIIECRRAVAFTYGLGYYIDESKRKLLEFLQKELEFNLEKLENKTDESIMDYFDKESGKMNADITVFENDIKNLTLTLNKYFTNMIDSFEKDMLKNRNLKDEKDSKQQTYQKNEKKRNNGKKQQKRKKGEKDRYEIFSE